MINRGPDPGTKPQVDDALNLIDENRALESRVEDADPASYRDLTNRSAHRGKSGGFRAIYLSDQEGRFIFVHSHSKTDQNDASASEILERIKDIE